MSNLLELGNIKRKKVSHRTLLHSLYDREINGIKTRMNCVKTTYQSVYPNCTVFNVEKPLCYPRKFTPDGRQLIAFSLNQTSIQVYDYLGCSMAANLLKNHEDDCIDQNSGENIRMHIFERLFQLKHQIKVSYSDEKLNRECSLFTKDGNYAVVGSAETIPEESRPQFYEMYTSNEAVCPHPLYPLDNYTIHLVDLKRGAVSHYIHFKYDKICLSHNQGIYLLENTLAILSIQHQTIHIYQIIQNQFCLVRRIGRFCREDDYLTLSSVYTFMKRRTYRPYRENSITGLKNKLMIFLYKKADQKAQETGSQYPLGKFYQHFNQLLSLRMWKMQLLDENHVLIKYASEDIVTSKAHDPNARLSYFMIYNMATTTVLDVFVNTSDDLLKLYENFCDYFRNSYANPEGFIPCSPANNLYSWELHQHLKNAKFGGKLEGNKQILAQLPLAAQSFTSSPYLDTSLYSYDENCISSMERPRIVGEYPIRFYSRESGLLSFCLYTSESKGPQTLDHRRLTAFTFHPTDPFAFSIQMIDNKYVVHFYIRKVYMPE